MSTSALGHPTLAQLLRALAERLEADAAPQAEADPMLTVAEAARELGLSPSYVREQCRSRAIKAMDVGRGYRIRRSALLTYERRRTP
jgi:excisionase family DNA binding protein